jgi:hypothetical protein
VIPVVVGSSPIGHPTLFVLRDSDHAGLEMYSQIGNILRYRFGRGAGRKQADRGFRFITFTKDSSLLPAAVGKEVAAILGKDTAVKQTSQKDYT